MKHQPLIFATFLSPVLYKTCLYITKYLEQLTGIPTFLLPGEDLEDFAAGAIDAGFISGLYRGAQKQFIHRSRRFAGMYLGMLYQRIPRKALIRGISIHA